MNPYDWTQKISLLYKKAVRQYQAGGRDPEAFFTEEELETLAAVGAKPIELYDYAEDAHALDWETALLILAARRDYFLNVQQGRYPAKKQNLTVGDFPEKDAELDGIPWLPRLILKAQTRLRGELPRELMYGCGGDRAFFKKHHLHPADFLRFIASMDGDERKVVDYVRGKR